MTTTNDTETRSQAALAARVEALGYVLFRDYSADELGPRLYVCDPKTGRIPHIDTLEGTEEWLADQEREPGRLNGEQADFEDGLVREISQLFDAAKDRTHGFDKDRRWELIRIIDGLEDRIRWALGVLDRLTTADDLDHPDIDALSGTAAHLVEAKALMRRLNEWRDGIPQLAAEPSVSDGGAA